MYLQPGFHQINHLFKFGVCYGCSLRCHLQHEIEELFFKRGFRCDCGTPRSGLFKATFFVFVFVTCVLLKVTLANLLPLESRDWTMLKINTHKIFKGAGS